MAVINIAGVRSEGKGYTVHVVLTAEPVIDQETPIDVFGEAFVEIPEATEMSDVKDRIIEAAREIMKKRQDSIDKRKDLEELDFPPIE